MFITVTESFHCQHKRTDKISVLGVLPLLPGLHFCGLFVFSAQQRSENTGGNKRKIGNQVKRLLFWKDKGTLEIDTVLVPL